MSILQVFTNANYRQLLSELTKREIKQRYKQSFLGYLWVIVNPLAQMIVLSFVFSKLVNVSDLGVPYPIFLFSGLLMWNLLSNSLSASAGALVGNAGLLTKIYFPREILILSTILAKIVDFAFASIIFIGMMFIFQIPFTIYMLWFIPIFIVQNIFTYGLCLLISTFNLFYRDAQYLLNLILMLWMYLTPVMYAPELFPEQWRWIFQLNPMAVLINAYRQVLLAGDNPNLISLAIITGLSVGVVGIGFAVFKKLEGHFADAV